MPKTESQIVSEDRAFALMLKHELIAAMREGDASAIQHLTRMLGFERPDA